MKNILVLSLVCFVSFFAITNLYAIRATPYPIEVKQSDGTTLTIRLQGNEFFHYKITLDGYLLTPDKDGILNYATVDKNGVFKSTSIKARDIEKRTDAERNFLSKIRPNIDLSNVVTLQRSMRYSARQKIETSSSPERVFPLGGTPKSLVILVNFKDVAFTTLNPKTAFTNLLNQQGYSENGATGSARDFFRDNSMGHFNPEFDVVGPYTLPKNMAYYGENDITDNDTLPQQMVIDACTLAANNGVDFSQYDTDSDGYVDNVFIYYAGYNEAEGAPENTVWPHRWTLNNNSTKFNGKIIFDYACTSELRSRFPFTDMCGIGTFVHEFGHVLGLPDYYATDDGKHQTLSYWSTMDAGPYLNAGRTPPSYSAYDRFFLGWLTPDELKIPGGYTLENLSSSNKALVITEKGNHNLNGENPSPREFFMLENRQLVGWDKFLPKSGMLVTHIYYNPTAWINNTVNNNANAMGVDIVEADGVASDASLIGDPFPGAAKVTTFIPVLRSGTELGNKQISQITEKNSLISFMFIDYFYNELYPPMALDADNITTGSIEAKWNAVENANGYYLTAYQIEDGTSEFSEGFDQEIVSNGWMINTDKRSSSSVYSGKNIPAVQFSNSTDTIITEEYILPASKLSFFIRSLSGLNSKVYVEAKNQNGWTKIDSVSVTSSLAGIKYYTLDVNSNYTRFRFTYKKVVGDVVIDDITVGFNKKLGFAKRESWTTAFADTLMNLKPDTQYYYKLRSAIRILGSDNTILLQKVSDFSNTIEASTLEKRQGNIFRVKDDGSVELLMPTTDLVVNVYNIIGQKVKTIYPKSTIFKIEGLPKNQVYIIAAGDQRAKIMLF